MKQIKPFHVRGETAKGSIFAVHENGKILEFRAHEGRARWPHFTVIATCFAVYRKRSHCELYIPVHLRASMCSLIMRIKPRLIVNSHLQVINSISGSSSNHYRTPLINSRPLWDSFHFSEARTFPRGKNGG